MNRAFSVLLFIAPVIIGMLGSCSSDVPDEVQTEEKSGDESAMEEPEDSNAEKTYLFKSDDEEGVVEYMRCTQLPDGSQSWVYFTSKNEKEIELGSREQAGFEVVYFQGKPKELYWIYGSECGFTLSDETRRKSQWYGQVTPKCADDMFE